MSLFQCSGGGVVGGGEVRAVVVGIKDVVVKFGGEVAEFLGGE